MATAPQLELWKLSATELAAGYRAGSFEPVAVLESVLDRIATHNPVLNAIVTLDQQGALAAALASGERYRRNQALGPLDGVPVTVKDNIAVGGLRCTWGSRLFAEQVCAQDELPIARIRAAGAVILGKTNTPEFAMVGHTDNEVFGATRNPWNTALSVGGSSGGAVAAVAAGMAPIALGTDGGGSIRRPASHTGLVGIKPSRGRVPRADGLPAIFLDYEVIGPLARTVDDAIAVMQLISAPDPRDAASRGFVNRVFEVPTQVPPLRILHIPKFGDAPVDPEISDRVAEAAEDFRSLGHQVDVSSHFGLADAINSRWMQLSQVGLAHILKPHGDWRERLTPTAIANADAGSALSATSLFDLLQMIDCLSNRLGETFARYDVLLTPAAAALPWPIEQVYPGRIDGHEVGPRGHAVFTGFVNAAGLPAIALPCSPTAGGVPNGLQLVGRWADDGLLCALARQYEQKCRWHSRWPSL